MSMNYAGNTGFSSHHKMPEVSVGQFAQPGDASRGRGRSRDVRCFTKDVFAVSPKILAGGFLGSSPEKCHSGQ